MTRQDTYLISGSWAEAPAAVLPRAISGAYYQRKAWVSGRIVHPYWVLDYSCSNAGKVRVSSPRSPWLPRPARVAHLYPPAMPYWENAKPSTDVVRAAYATFIGGREAGLQFLLDRSPLGYARILDPGAQLEPHLRQIALAGRISGNAGFWQAQSGFAALVSVLLTATGQGDAWLLADKTAESNDDKLVRTVEDYFRAHLAERVTLADLASHLHVSPSTLSHHYNRRTGRSPITALIALRIETGKGLLLKGYPLKSIAGWTGFTDAFHFSRTFKRILGLAPRAFRERAFHSARALASVSRNHAAV